MKLWKNFYQPPTMKITRETDEKMRQLVKLTDTEIAWHGFLQYDINTDTYTLYDIVLFPQIVTSVTVQTDDDKYCDFIEEMMERPDFENMRLHGHSHVNMGVTPSGTDMKYRSDLLKIVKDYYIFMITNRSGDIELEFYDAKNNIVWNDEDINIIYEEEDYSEWIKENKEKCLTYQNHLKPSTLAWSKDPFTSWAAELWDPGLPNSWPGLE